MPIQAYTNVNVLIPLPFLLRICHTVSTIKHLDFVSHLTMYAEISLYQLKTLIIIIIFCSYIVCHGIDCHNLTNPTSVVIDLFSVFHKIGYFV